MTRTLTCIRGRSSCSRSMPHHASRVRVRVTAAITTRFSRTIMALRRTFDNLRMRTMDAIKPLFTATATATGGRNGRTEASDGSVGFNLSVPKEMGGPGKPGTATPQHPFAARYAARLGRALDLVAQRHQQDRSKGTSNL